MGYFLSAEQFLIKSEKNQGTLLGFEKSEGLLEKYFSFLTVKLDCLIYEFFFLPCVSFYLNLKDFT